MSETDTINCWAYTRTTVCVIAIANLSPLIGVTWFGWEISDLLLAYWLEAVFAAGVGMVRTFPAKLISVPLTDPRSEPLLKTRRGTVSIAGIITGYVRNIPGIAAQSLFFLFYAFPILALLVPASPLYYSFHETIGGVALIGGSLAGTHVVTANAYFDEERYARATPPMAAGFSFVTGSGICGLAVLLLVWDAEYGPVPETWPVVLSYVIVGGKVCMELVFRCRDRDRFEPLDESTDVFDFQTDAMDVLFRREPGSKITELPPVERPHAYPESTVRPSRTGIVRASPVLGFAARLADLSVFIFALGGLLVVADGQLALPLAMWAIAIVLLVLPVLCCTLPRHATLEYECYDDRLVCHDRWVDEPVWALSYDEIEDVAVERGLAARLGGYATVVLETTDDRPANLRYLRDYRAVADRLEQATDRVQR